ncbi:hypothetical protein D9M69_731080 [compost metagenome]
MSIIIIVGLRYSLLKLIKLTVGNIAPDIYHLAYGIGFQYFSYSGIGKLVIRTRLFYNYIQVCNNLVERIPAAACTGGGYAVAVVSPILH